MRCAPDFYCNTDADEPTCVPLARVGEDCSDRACAGDDDGFIFSSVQCDETTQTCQATVKAGATCDPPPCHDLYTCSPATSTCESRPSEGEDCTLSIDVAEPTHNQWVALIAEAGHACQLALDGHRSAGEYCVQEGATSGHGQCTALPGEGEPCGLGNGLSPRCQRGFYCEEVDPEGLDLVEGICVEGEPLYGPCNAQFVELGLGDPCEAGAVCVQGECVPECSW
jgi:hypothetical protein